MQKNTKPDRTECLECIPCHVDNVLAISHDPKSIIDYLSTAYTLKAESVKALDECLGSQICKHKIKGNLDTWAVSSDLCVKRAPADLERELAKMNQTLCNKVPTPLSNGCRPELDQPPELDAQRSNCH